MTPRAVSSSCGTTHPEAGCVLLSLNNLLAARSKGQ
jgi:hypothetical protein